jgi:hypothetical protein
MLKKISSGYCSSFFILLYKIPFTTPKMSYFVQLTAIFQRRSMRRGRGLYGFINDIKDSQTTGQKASTQAALSKFNHKLEREVNTMEQPDPVFEESPVDQTKTWVQENLRIIVSVFIVAAIALGIYSYSQRAQNISDENAGGLLETKGSTEETQSQDNRSPSMVKEEAKKSVIVTEELSRETETSFVERAERGNGSTHLARRALAHYLEKNADSSLTAEHKVYIEDYLRKNVGFRDHVTTKTSIEFSKDLIKQGIEKSKTLNDRQLKNLKKYSARVSAYR